MQGFEVLWYFGFNWIIFSIITGIIYAIYIIISFGIRRGLKKAKLNLDIINGVKAALRLISIISVFVIFIYMSPCIRDSRPKRVFFIFRLTLHGETYSVKSFVLDDSLKM